MSEIDSDLMLPAAGQGALALQCRRGDAKTIAALRRLNDPVTERVVSVERDVVAALNGDCHSPIACWCQEFARTQRLRVAVGKRDGRLPILKADASAPIDQSQFLVGEVVNQLQDQGVVEHLHRS